MYNENDSNLDFFKKFPFDPEKTSVEGLAKCFSYKSTLPQVVIDKIVESYDEKSKKFANVEISLNDFCTGYESKPQVTDRELLESIHDIYKKF
ncbi:MAG: hypothetical protein MJ245_02370 [Clostridia bacterium]|nr:hypothetical protein [Clostridia bacterium]